VRARATKLVSEFDVGHTFEHFWHGTARPSVRTPEQAAALLRWMIPAEQEMLVVLNLTRRQATMSRRIVALGSPNDVYVHVASVFRGAIREGASCIIVAHNHPSGDPTPSDSDLLLQRRLVTAGELLGVTVCDHIVVAREGYYSFSTNLSRNWSE